MGEITISARAAMRFIGIILLTIVTTTSMSAMVARVCVWEYPSMRGESLLFAFCITYAFAATLVLVAATLVKGYICFANLWNANPSITINRKRQTIVPRAVALYDEKRCEECLDLLPKNESGLCYNCCVDIEVNRREVEESRDTSRSQFKSGEVR